jgi:hypothetical protein
MLGERVREANVFRTRDIVTDKIVYFVGTYREGRYRRPFTAQERMRTGCNAEFGTLSDVAHPYKSLAGAKNAATKEYGYALVENAVYALGTRFGAI